MQSLGYVRTESAQVRRKRTANRERDRQPEPDRHKDGDGEEVTIFDNHANVDWFVLAVSGSVSYRDCCRHVWLLTSRLIELCKGHVAFSSSPERFARLDKSIAAREADIV
jgi:hypothetical protein